jgi:plasmid stability protein
VPALHVRNVPEDLYRRIAERAASERRSLAAEVIELLEMALQERERAMAQADLLARIRRRRSSRLPLIGAPESVALLREDRER